MRAAAHKMSLTIASWGLIPACAGEPQGRSWCMTDARVYPRVCGGTLDVVAVDPDIWGLSPRVRGNRSLQSTSSLATGSIPACAGEPQANLESNADYQVYPRVCGGTQRLQGKQGSVMALSPRVRGNLKEIVP